jgi:hypothetical protein
VEAFNIASTHINGGAPGEQAMFILNKEGHIEYGGCRLTFFSFLFTPPLICLVKPPPTLWGPRILKEKKVTHYATTHDIPLFYI